jgi:hypothetical protein
MGAVSDTIEGVPEMLNEVTNDGREESQASEAPEADRPSQERVSDSPSGIIPGSVAGTATEDPATDDRGSPDSPGCPPEGKRDQPSPGHVYLIGVLDGCHKIGKTNNIHRRVPEVGAKLPVELQVVHAIPVSDMAWLESYLHLAFRHRRVRGEWFRLSDDEIAIIQSIPAADLVSDLPPAVIALHEQNWLVLHPPKKPKKIAAGGGKRVDGMMRIEVLFPPEVGKAVRRAAAAVGMGVGQWCAMIAARSVGITYIPPKKGRKKKSEK